MLGRGLRFLRWVLRVLSVSCFALTFILCVYCVYACCEFPLDMSVGLGLIVQFVWSLLFINSLVGHFHLLLCCA